ncbi:hypothetical protein [Mucilaginibacter sp. dw_454]|uniref:hypothetical protein n=1 Tax=Mucilaginibacter sp. dw_454 TaxID=2720079 RepID=UPI001BD48005|nr:hypothetical protein [Mucilaginibacter sp. dw_454]
MSNYLISIPQSQTKVTATIHDQKSNLKVKAVKLATLTYKTAKGEVSFFVTIGKKILAFETKGYNKHRQLLILQMISCYCMYMGWVEAQIHATLPV